MRYNFHTNCFEEREKNPDKIAFSGSDKDISWKELGVLIDELTVVIKSIEVPQGHPVILYGHKEHLYPTAILALIHNNIPYIPVDKIYPLERVKKIAEITGSQILINCGNYALDINIPVQIDLNLNIVHNGEPNYNNRQYDDASDPLQYIMFTSGSTGEPKGVCINRSSVLSFIDWIAADYPFTEWDVFMNQSPFTFDVSLYDMLSALMLGATVLLIDTEISKTPDKFFEKLAAYKCSVWTSTPSFIYIYLRELNFNGEHFPGIKTFLFAGEDLPPKTAGALLQQFPNAKVYNAYGPTEATVTTTLIEITADIVKNNPVLPIGYPKRDAEILIDNKDEAGSGEIIIVGDHVSVGYFNDDALSATKFFVHGGKRAFRTGDLGHYENDMVFFTGRNDDQIKLHGYRIEMGEITSQIRNLSFIADAVTVPLKRGNEVKRIVSFVILESNIDMPGDKVKQTVVDAIAPLVPTYMIPGDVRAIKEFPTGGSHKIDKTRLIEMYINNEF